MADETHVTSLAFEVVGKDKFKSDSKEIVDSTKQLDAAATRSAEVTEATTRRKIAAQNALSKADSGTKAALEAAKNADVLSDAINKTMVVAARHEAAVNRAARVVDPLGLALKQAQKLYDDLSRVATSSSDKAASAADLLSAAAKRVADAQRAVAVASAQIDPALARLIEKFDPATASARRMAAELAELNAAFRAGVNIAGGYTNAWNGIIEKYDEGAQAAKRAAAAQKELIDQARAAQNATNNQDWFNEKLGVNPTSGRGSAAASAAVFQEAFAEQDRLTAATEKYLRVLDPTRAATQAYHADLDQLAELQAKGALSALEAAVAEDKITAAYDKQIHTLSGLAEAERQAAEAKKQAKADAQAAEDAQLQLAAAAQQYRDKLDPLAAVQRKHSEELQRLSELEKAGALSMAETARAIDQAKAAHLAEIEVVSGAAEASRKESDALKQLQQEAQQIKDRLDPTAATQRNYASAVERVNALQRAGLLTNEQYSKALKLVETDLQRGTLTTRGMQFAITNLWFQINDVATSVASGISPMRTLAQQGGQFIQVFQQGGGVRNVLSAFATTLRSWITPTTLVVAGIGAATTAVGVLVARSLTAEDSARKFGVTLRGLGADSLATGSGLEQAAKRLRDIGLAASDARSEIAAVTRAGLNPNRAEGIIRTGKDIEAILGGNGTETLTTALSGGLESTIKLGIQLRAFDANMISAWRNMARLGQGADALTQAFEKISAKVAGADRDALSPFAQRIRDLKTAWTEAMDALSNSKPIEAIVELLTNAGRGLERLAKLDFSDWNKGVVASAPIPKGVTGTSGTSAGSSGAGSAAAAANEALSMVGLNVGRNGAQIQQYLASGGVNLSPQDVAWCAAFANAALARQGLKGTGSNVATSFLNWGTSVAGDVQAGDIIVIPRGRSAGQTGGHVGLATGATQLSDRGLLLEMVSGNEGHAVAKSYVNANEAVVRRAADAASPSGVAIAAGGIENRNPVDAKAAVDKRLDEEERQIEVLQRLGAVSDVVRAKQQAETQAVEDHLDPEQKKRLEIELIADVYKRVTAEQNKAIAQTGLEITGIKDITEGYQKSAAAGLEAESQVKATAEAYQQFGELQSEAAKKFISSRSDQFLVLEQNNLRRNFAEQNARDRDTTVQLNLEASLQGKTNEEINRRIDLLKVIQEAEAKRLDLTDKTVQSRLKEVDALSQAKIALDDAQRAQERLNDAIRDIVGTIENELTTSIQNAFSEEKVESWGKRINRVLGSVTSSISNSLFLKPLIGTGLSAVGLTGLAQSYGTFGNLFGTTGGTSAGSGPIEIKDSNGNVLTVGNASSVLSLGQSAGLLDSLGLKNVFGGGSGFLSNISLGGLFKTSTVDEAAGDFGGSAGLLDTTLGEALRGVGVGFGAGALLTSLLGKNKIGGTIGSGVGSLLGTGIGSLFGSSILGGIGGGLFGSLGGFFGNTRPRANATGLSIDLATGAISGYQSSGSAENDKTANELRDSISDFTKTLQDTTKGTVSGYINPQATDQGIKLDYSIPGFGSGTYTTKDSQDAIDKAELAIARGLTGISNTMKTVIDQVTDPSKLDAAITFAKTYDKIADAAKEAFSSIPSDLQTEGPFAKAKDDIKTTFDDIEADAKKFGLSLQPVTDALDEANRRLTKDFDRYIQDLITAAEDPLQSLVDIEKRAGDARVRDAKAVSGDLVAVNKYNAEALDKIWKDQTKDIQDLRDELKTGDLSGLTATQRLGAANDNYKKFLADVQAGKTAEFSDLVTSARNLFSLSTDAYGQGPATAKTRTQLISDLDAVLASRSFASGTSATPPGMILVGEKGPELISQPGGLRVYTHRETEKILAAMPSFPKEMSFAEGTGERYLPTPTIPLPNGQMRSPDSNDETVRLLRDLVTAVNANTRTAGQGHYETGKKLDEQTTELRQKPLYEPTRRKVAA